MKKPLSRFLVRWFVCTLGLWISAGLLGQRVSYESHIGVVITAGFMLAIVNVFIKPLVIILSLPAILFSLGLFIIIINGLMVLLVSKLYSPFHVTNFGAALLAGMVIGLVNYLVTTILEDS
jgi:putative membrane protein